nr:ATP-binding protein [Actinoplanes lichenis]
MAILQNLILAVPILVVYAPSGTGKSSLLNAGLLPVVKKDPQYVPIVINGPEQDVTRLAARKLSASGWTGGAHASREGLAALLERHHEGTGRRALLVLDQFEERFNNEPDLDALYAQLARLGNTRSSAATVVLSLREDYLAGLAGLMDRVSGLLDASYRVSDLSRDDLAEAVTGPLAAVGESAGIEDGLVDEVLDDLERETRSDGIARSGRIEAGYFQVVWSRLWERGIGDGGRQMTRATYAAENKAAGILESFVSSILSELLPLEAEILWATLRYMILPTGAKVPLTVDDILGQLRVVDFAPWAAGVFRVYGRDDYTVDGMVVDRAAVRPHLKSMLDYLKRTESPLFRRAVRGERTEYELVHDLLGPILLDWQRQHVLARDAAMARMRDEVIGERGRSAFGSGHAAIPVARKNLRHSIALLDGTGDSAVSANDVNAARILTRSASAIIAASGRPPDEETQDLLIRHQAVLTRVMLAHPDRDVRGAAQRNSYEAFALERFFRAQYFDPRPATKVLVWFAGALAAAAGLIVARLVLDFVGDLPAVQYAPLTLGIVVALAAALQTAAYTERSSREYDRQAAKHILWPRNPRRSQGFPLGVRMFLGWPAVYLVLTLAAYAGASLFALFDLAPTAGFNLAMLVAGFVLGALYAVESDL